MVLPANSLRFSIVTDSGLPRTETKCFIYATTFSAGLRAVRIHAQTLPRVPIYDYEDPEPAAIGQSVTHKFVTAPLSAITLPSTFFSFTGAKPILYGCG